MLVNLSAFSASGAAEHPITLQCVTLDFDTTGNTAMGNIAMGNTAMGNIAMGNTAMGNTAMGNTAMGNTAVSLLRAVLCCATCSKLVRDLDVRIQGSDKLTVLFHTCRAQGKPVCSTYTHMYLMLVDAYGLGALACYHSKQLLN